MKAIRIRPEHIEEQYRDSDGYWIYFKPGWRSATDPVACVHGVVEDRKRDAMSGGVLPCDCDDCQAQPGYEPRKAVR